MRNFATANDPDETLGASKPASMFVMLNRGDYWQCAYCHPQKARPNASQKAGLPGVSGEHRRLSPLWAIASRSSRAGTTSSCSPLRLTGCEQWHRPGLLCIGDAAHAMSPIGGIGINLAVQDAVAAANLLYDPLRRGRPSDEDLAAVQRRRVFPMRVIQGIQLFIQDRIIRRVLASKQRPTAPAVLKLLDWLPVLRRVPAYIMGIGVQREHVRTPDAGHG